jgi:hypothetical protein
MEMAFDSNLDDFDPYSSLITTEADKKLFEALLEYVQSPAYANGEITGFILSDGTYRFSSSEMLDVFVKIELESAISDRLWTIVSVAYLEGQLRILLEMFMTDNETSRELLDPNQSLMASLVPMANLAFSLGLLAPNWHSTLKKMAQLRNKFAHIPSARSFGELLQVDAKASGLLQSLEDSYTRIAHERIEKGTEFKQTYQALFRAMFLLLQFAIDHIALAHKRQTLDNGLVASIRTFMGHNADSIKALLSANS